MAEKTPPAGPDLTQGVDIALVKEGEIFAGHVGDTNIAVVRRGNDLLAVTAKCTHYSGNLQRGLVDGDTIRCPLHHACFSLRTGEALLAPAFDPIACWRVDRDGDRLYVRERIEASATTRAAHGPGPKSIVIIGGGAAGFAAAEM